MEFETTANCFFCKRDYLKRNGTEITNPKNSEIVNLCSSKECRDDLVAGKYPRYIPDSQTKDKGEIFKTMKMTHIESSGRKLDEEKNTKQVQRQPCWIRPKGKERQIWLATLTKDIDQKLVDAMKQIHINSGRRLVDEKDVKEAQRSLCLIRPEGKATPPTSTPRQVDDGDHCLQSHRVCIDNDGNEHEVDYDDDDDGKTSRPPAGYSYWRPLSYNK